MPTSATVKDTLWGGAEVVHTYDAQSRLSATTMFLPNGYTGSVRFATVTATYAAPVTGRADLTPTAGGTVETLNTRLGMRWTVAVGAAITVDRQAMTVALRTA